MTPAIAIRDMVGRTLSAFFQRTRTEPGAVVLETRELGREGAFSGVSFELRSGEVLGFAGLVGARRTDVGLALFGIAPADSGTILLDGQVVRIRNPQDALRLGIAYSTEDRRQLGLVFPMSIAANISLPTLGRYLNPLGLIRRAGEEASAERHRDRLRIRARSVREPVAVLSGGNQQKVVLSKWLETRPRVLILDEPTRGIDVGLEGGGAPDHRRAGPRGHRDHPDQLRPARGARHQRPHPGHARGPPDGDPGPRRRDRRAGACAPPWARRAEPSGGGRPDGDASCAAFAPNSFASSRWS